MRFIKFYFLFFLSSAFCYSQANWKLQKDFLGINVFTRSVDFSPLKEYKVSTVIKTPINSLIKILVNGDYLKEWNYRTTKSRLLGVGSGNKYLVYMYNDLPWPAKNRDHVSELKLEYINDSLVRINIKSKPDKIIKTKGVIRVINFSGFWLLEKTKIGVKVTQQMYGDPGGYLPAFIVNSFIVDAPFSTFKKLKEHFEK